MIKSRFDLKKTWFLDKDQPYDKAIGSYDVEWGEQPDLLYARSIFCSEGGNKRFDGFLRTVLVRNYKSAINKFVDYEHDENGENKNGKNPHKYHIIGHIYGSHMADQATGEIIPDEECVIGEDGLAFAVDSPWRGSKLDVVVDWVLYKFEFPEIADEIYENKSDASTGFGVSMEILFADYKFRVGEFDPNEKFEYDASKDGAIEVRKGTGLATVLSEFLKARIKYNGKNVYRIIGEPAIFSGMAVTANRANPRSWNIATASDSVDSYVETNKDKSKLTEIIKSVASRGGFVEEAACNIIDGEPDCDCIERALASESRLLLENMEKLKAFMSREELGYELEEELEPDDEPLSEDDEEKLRETHEEGEYAEDEKNMDSKKNC